jgi:hypothetical protein
MRCPLHQPGAADPSALVADAEGAPVAGAEFRRRLEEGEYRRLFDEKLKQVIAQAAIERGLADEIGALRVVLARLLLEEDDLSKLVSGVARLASVTVQAARAQRTIAGEVGDGLAEAINQYLAELEAP